MCIYKQGEKWWYEFEFQGQRVRKSTRTTDRDLAKLIEAEHRRSLEMGIGGISPTLEAIKTREKADRWMPPPPIANEDSTEPKPVGLYARKYAGEPKINRGMSLREAGEIWFATKRDWKRRKPKTLECARCYLNSLIRFFGDTPLRDIQPRSILAYQTARSKEVGTSAINHEINALSQILKLCGLWGPIRDYYGPLKEPSWKPPKTFTLEEQQYIFDIAKSDPNLELAEIVFTITRNTSASGCELRLSRLECLDLDSPNPTFRITGDVTKNAVRPRLVPLNAAAACAFRRAVDRAARLGSHLPQHYIFPYRANRAKYDPNRPASKSWLRKQTATLRDRTGIEHIRPHAWRHQLCTEMLEQGVPEQTVIGIMGWCSKRMIETYSHTRLEAKADALSVLERVGHQETPAVPRKRQRPKPDHRAPAQVLLPADIMHPAIQAEIARQVALALEQRELSPAAPSPVPAAGPRLLTFPATR